MSTPTTNEQDNLRSRLPDPSQFFPEMAGIAAGMFKVTGNGAVPQTTISLVQLRAGQIVGNTYHTVRPGWGERVRGRCPVLRVLTDTGG